MLRALKQLDGYHLATEDGEFGKVVDVLFDDEHWTVRYLVAKTGPWLLGRKVLIYAQLLGAPEWTTQTIRTQLTKEQIKGAPELDADAPVSRQRERELLAYFGTAPYWHPAPPPPLPVLPVQESADSHLRSVRAVTGYRLAANDEDFGEVADFICEDRSWVIRFLVVALRRGPRARSVLVAPGWVNRIEWSTNRVYLPLDRGQIEKAPEYRPEAPINRAYETRLYDYYGRPYPW